MDLGLTGRVAMVTGSSRGIGRATAELFAREGARAVVTYRSDRSRAEAVAVAIRESGGEAIAVALDLASRDSIRSAFTITCERFGKVDILVNNAIERGAPPFDEQAAFEEVPEREWVEPLRANIEGCYSAVQVVLSGMRQRRWGRIVNVSSDLAVEGLPGAGWYAAAKSALHGLTTTLAAELRLHGIITNAVMPATTLTERLRERYGVPDEQPTEIALARSFLLPEEVAPTIVYLCSAANIAINGQVIRVGNRPRWKE